jgi:hypothetical protein
MKVAKNFYNGLPTGVRVRLRMLVPGDVRRWYAHRKTDVYIISYPKCGRTWLRLMIGRAISQHFKLPQDENLLFLRWQSKPHPQLPMITVVHEDRPMLKSPEELEISKDKFRDKKIIFLARDPRDVIISSYFEMKKRGNLFGDNPYETRKAVFSGDLSEFIDRSQGGFDTILQYYNIWVENRQIPAGFLLVRYEDMKQDPYRELRRVLDFLGLNVIDADAVNEAVDFAAFENMRKMEAAGSFQGGMLNPAEISDQESYKTRKGQVGGYKNYLSESDVQRLNRKIQNDLSPYYGYTTG